MYLKPQAHRTILFGIQFPDTVTDPELMNLLHLDLFLFINQSPFYAPAMFVEKSYTYLKKDKYKQINLIKGIKPKNKKAQH